jgi:amidase
MTDLAGLDATAQAALVRAGELTARELVAAAIERARRVDPELHAIIHPRFEAAEDEADGRASAEPFGGVPFVLKDLDGAMGGEPYHGGTRFLRDRGYVAPADTELTARFHAAGLVTIGRTNTPELGLVPTTEPATCGPTRNPWDPTRSTGGSSGGSAACVAAGIVPMGHAGDGGGSIRIPAAHCGLVGLKPSRGRITVGPEVGESWGGLVARLAVTRSVRDTAALLDAVAGPGVGDPYGPALPAGRYLEALAADPRPLRIGWTSASLDGSLEVDPQVAAATEATARLLVELGHQVDEVVPAALGRVPIDHFLTAYSAWSARDLDHLGELVGEPVTAEGVEPGTWALAEAGRAVSAAAYLAAIDGLHAFTRDLVAWWAVEGWDVLLTPTVPELPPTLGQFPSTSEEPLTGLFRAATTVHDTAPFNISGQPAISLPLHQSAEGLPIGMQLIGAPGREDVLLALSGQLERAVPWAARRPAIWAG